MLVSNIIAFQDNDQATAALQWFAMRATYHREMAVKQLLEQSRIEAYLPLKQVLRTINGRKTRMMEPLVSSLIFVHSDKETLKHFKSKVQYLQYMTMRMDGKNVPIIVPDKQMQDFMAVTREEHNFLSFFKPDEIDLSKGTPVRLHGGALDGIEGTFMRVAGRRKRSVVIEIKDVLTVAVDATDAQFVEVL